MRGIVMRPVRECSFRFTVVFLNYLISEFAFLRYVETVFSVMQGLFRKGGTLIVSINLGG